MYCQTEIVVRLRILQIHTEHSPELGHGVVRMAGLTQRQAELVEDVRAAKALDSKCAPRHTASSRQCTGSGSSMGTTRSPFTLASS
jgi:hypothetical protein